MLWPAKTDWACRGNSGIARSFNRPLSHMSLPLSFLWQENRIQQCSDKLQVPFRNSPVRNRLELSLHIRSASWSTLQFYHMPFSLPPHLHRCILKIFSIPRSEYDIIWGVVQCSTAYNSTTLPRLTWTVTTLGATPLCMCITQIPHALHWHL